MPTYVYKFLDTGETLEVQQSFSDPTLTEAVHPVTGATLPVKKVYLPVGVTFRGDGFYKTDSRSGSKKSSAGDSTNSGSSGDSGSTGSKDSGSKDAGTATSATSTPSKAGSAASSGD